MAQARGPFLGSESGSGGPREAATFGLVRKHPTQMSRMVVWPRREGMSQEREAPLAARDTGLVDTQSHLLPHQPVARAWENHFPSQVSVSCGLRWGPSPRNSQYHSVLSFREAHWCLIMACVVSPCAPGTVPRGTPIFSPTLCEPSWQVQGAAFTLPQPLREA